MPERREGPRPDRPDTFGTGGLSLCEVAAATDQRAVPADAMYGPAPTGGAPRARCRVLRRRIHRLPLALVELFGEQGIDVLDDVRLAALELGESDASAMASTTRWRCPLDSWWGKDAAIRAGSVLRRPRHPCTRSLIEAYSTGRADPAAGTPVRHGPGADRGCRYRRRCAQAVEECAASLRPLDPVTIRVGSACIRDDRDEEPWRAE